MAFGEGGLPRIRGGVSKGAGKQAGVAPSSPHTRGCFQGEQLRFLVPKVFPAYAGVFLTSCLKWTIIRGLPRIRGGVSCPYFEEMGLSKSSPHTRGCFYPLHAVRATLAVFPAYAGVFPRLCTAV